MIVEKEVIKEIWCDVINIDQLEYDDKFYDLGGNSIMMLLIIDKVKEKFHVELPVTEFEQYDSVTKMVEYIKKF